MYCETFKDNKYSPRLNAGIRNCRNENIFPSNFAELAGLQQQHEGLTSIYVNSHFNHIDEVGV
jgi:hypothetical protein